MKPIGLTFWQQFETFHHFLFLFLFLLVVKATVLLADINDYAKVNDVYKTGEYIFNNGL